MPLFALLNQMIRELLAALLGEPLFTPAALEAADTAGEQIGQRPGLAGLRSRRLPLGRTMRAVRDYGGACAR